MNDVGYLRDLIDNYLELYPVADREAARVKLIALIELAYMKGQNDEASGSLQRRMMATKP